MIFIAAFPSSVHDVNKTLVVPKSSLLSCWNLQTSPSHEKISLLLLLLQLLIIFTSLFFFFKVPGGGYATQR